MSVMFSIASSARPPSENRLRERGQIDARATIMVRMTVGDPTSIREVPLKWIACFEPDRHPWWYRLKHYYGDNPTAFVFTDDGLDWKET